MCIVKIMENYSRRISNEKFKRISHANETNTDKILSIFSNNKYNVVELFDRKD